jgi:large subunit ribosomal protein L4
MATKTPIYNTLAKEDGTLLLPPEVFELPWNADLVYQVVLSMRSNKRAGTAHAKDRGEVSGGGR